MIITAYSCFICRHWENNHRKVQYKRGRLQDHGNSGAEDRTSQSWPTVEVRRRVLLRHNGPHHDRYVLQSYRCSEYRRMFKPSLLRVTTVTLLSIYIENCSITRLADGQMQFEKSKFDLQFGSLSTIVSVIQLSLFFLRK